MPDRTFGSGAKAPTPKHPARLGDPPVPDAAETLHKNQESVFLGPLLQLDL